MTFSRLILKMFRFNERKYRLFYLCCSFTIMIFFTFSTLLTNKAFLGLDPMITHNLYAPSLILVIFSIFFSIFTQNAFMKFRKSEFGLFMVLGMTPRDIRKMLLTESIALFLLSMVTGELAGSLFSIVFYWILTGLIGISTLSFSLSYQAYLLTSAFFIVLYIPIIAAGLITTLKMDLVRLLKEQRRPDRTRGSGPVTAAAGVLLIAAGVIDLVINYEYDKTFVFLRSLFCVLAGLYLIILNVIWFIERVLRRNRQRALKNMLFLADMKHTFGQSGKIVFIISILSAVTIFFCSLTFFITANSRDSAVKHNPWHIAFAEIYGKNKLPEETLERILQTKTEKPVKKITVEYLDQSLFRIFSDKALNTDFKTSFHVKKGCFITLFQVVRDDGYPHDLSEIKSVSIRMEDGETVLRSQGTVVKMLFNSIPVISNGYSLIVSEDDYRSMKASTKSFVTGCVHLINYRDWMKTQKIVDGLNQELLKYNRENTRQYFDKPEKDERAFKAAARISDYRQQLQSGLFVLFLFIFVGALFFLSSCVILHFALQNELERERIQYKKLYKVGITQNEIRMLLSRKVKVLFFLPVLFAILLAEFFVCKVINITDVSGKAMAYTAALGLIYMAFQVVYYMIYRRAYVKKVLSSL